MSGLVVPEILEKIDVFRRVHARSFASAHGAQFATLEGPESQ